MVKKTTIAHVIFIIALLYIISPWFFEKRLLFNELLSCIGFGILLYKRKQIVDFPINLYIIALILWGILHGITSLFRMDSFYYYLRNTVIIYSIFTFFIGFYALKYLGSFLTKIRSILRFYIGILLFFPVSLYLFERYGMATLFPSLLKSGKKISAIIFLIIINIIYAITYQSTTSFILSLFYIFIVLSPGYKFFKQSIILLFISFVFLFIYLIPNLNLISTNFSFKNEYAIKTVMASNKLLSLDPNNTWRLVLWKQLIIDQFPKNIFGLGFGTPALKYYPVADPSKLATLPYVLGAHNSFVYLFSRLGVVYLLIIIPIYSIIFKEYYYFNKHYKATKEILIFYSFFALSVISLFNPTLETPIYASGYWLMLGFTARSIYNRQKNYYLIQ